MSVDDIRDIRRASKKEYRSHTINPPTFQNQRSYIIEELLDAEQEHKYAKAAEINSILAAEAFSRAKATLAFWMQQQDPATKLFPSYLYAPIKFWDYRNTASDLFPFLIIAASFLDEKAYTQLLQTLSSEMQLSQGLPLPHTVVLGERTLIDEGLKEQIFGASEYIKDGLIPITERLGTDGPWFDRMEKLMDMLWAAAPVQTAFGRIPSNLAEPNGDLLQGLCRLYSATGKSDYLSWAERIGDVYLFEILPKTGFLPPKEWDFATGEFATDEVWLRDHGNELITGLAELACIECRESRARCGTYLEPLLAMLDLLLEKGRNEDGLWVNALDRHGNQLAVRKGPLCDNWGYLYAAYLSLSQMMEQKQITNPSGRKYRDEIKRALENLPRYRYFSWERKFEMDGQVDSIESALYLLNRIPVEAAFKWVEEEIGVLFALQKPDGSINRDYLDGNFIRTSLLYGFYKTGGAFIRPWREDVRIGASSCGQGLFVHLESEQPWEGKIYFDTPRHKQYHTANYPRVNEWPEWFTVDKSASYSITDLSNTSTTTNPGSELVSGISVSLKKNGAYTLFIKNPQP